MNSPKQLLRIAILGCGQIADAHLQEIRKVHAAELVAVCDVHQDLADQAAARYEVPQAYDDLDRMLDEAAPDVVHVATPVHSHAPLTCKLLEAGVHVYVEKPFTVDYAEAQRVIDTARQTGKRLCLGHDQLFDPLWLRLRELVTSGVIGQVTHVESVLGYPLSGQFGRQVTIDPQHWVRRLPGGLFQNTISHPLYRITDFLLDEQPAIHAHWQRIEDRSFPTEMTLSLRGVDVSGTLLFSTTIQPQRITRVYGQQGAFEIDPDAQVIRRIRQARLPGAFAKLEMPWRQWREAAGNFRLNFGRFLRSDIHYFAGMRNLFEAFYRSILDESELPISYEEMLRVTRLMEETFTLCSAPESRTARPPVSAVKRPTTDENGVPETMPERSGLGPPYSAAGTRSVVSTQDGLNRKMERIVEDEKSPLVVVSSSITLSTNGEVQS